MNDMARVIRSGEGQTVELPEGYRFDGAAVRISREGDRIVLEPVVDEPYDEHAIDEATGLSIVDLDRLVAEGLRGPDEPWDVEQLKRDFRDRFESERDRR